VRRNGDDQRQKAGTIKFSFQSHKGVDKLNGNCGKEDGFL